MDIYYRPEYSLAIDINILGDNVKKRFGILVAVAITVSLALSGCATSDSATSEEAATCAKADLAS